MKKKSKIIIIGKKKYLSDNLRISLIKKGYSKIFTNFDDNIDLKKINNIDKFFKKVRPEYIFFLGGIYGGIKTNIEQPSTLMIDNMFINSYIFYLSDKYNLKKLIYLSSSCVYPNNINRPLRPSDLFSNKLEITNQSYAIASLTGIELCRAYNVEKNKNFIPVIPSTIYGGSDIFLSENNSHVVVDLIKKIQFASLHKQDTVQLWGSGKPIRDFIHIDDLCNCLIFLMKNYNKSEPINAGINEYFSIFQIANVIKKGLKFKGKIIFDNKSKDGNLKKILNSSKVKRLGWINKVTTQEGIIKSCKWYKKNIN